MQLPYLLRTVCLAFAGTGLLQISFELSCNCITISLDRDRFQCNVRRMEKVIFTLGLGARLVPVILTGCLLLPAYVQGEDNRSSEHVGVVCILLAALVAGWWLWCLVRYIRATTGLPRSCRSLENIGQTRHGIPVLLYPGRHSLMAVLGVLTPKLVVSETLLNESLYSREALEVAFTHENAHVTHHDNLKLLLLSALPHVPFSVPGFRSLQQRWQLYAELAADRESVNSEADRSILLAEMLLKVARCNHVVLAQTSMSLLSKKEDLRFRVECLLEIAQGQKSLPKTGEGYWVLLTLSVLLILVVATGYTCHHIGHKAAEILLHIG